MRVVLLSFVLVLALTGCRAIWNPTFMPDGYAHHQKPYKTPPGPEATPIGYDFTVQKNDQALRQWQEAADDLVRKAAAQIPSGSSVSLTTDLSESAFRSAFEHALLEALHAQGVTLADEMSSAQALFYSAYDPQEQSPVETLAHYNDDPHHPDARGDYLGCVKTMGLVLQLWKDGASTEEVSGMYDVPSYGFKPAGYEPSYARSRYISEARGVKDMDDGFNP